MNPNDRLQNEMSEISRNLIQMHVRKVLQQNNISNQSRESLSEEQRSSLKEMIQGLQKEVDQFLAANNTGSNANEENNS